MRVIKKREKSTENPIHFPFQKIFFPSRVQKSVESQALSAERERSQQSLNSESSLPLIKGRVLISFPLQRGWSELP